MKILKGKALITPVVKGIENDSTIEIASPKLKINDLVITEGAYGLPDSTAVTIKK
jgi:hypothetical protein